MSIPATSLPAGHPRRRARAHHWHLWPRDPLGQPTVQRHAEWYRRLRKRAHSRRYARQTWSLRWPLTPRRTGWSVLGISRLAH